LRALSLITPVHENEVRTALWVTLQAFLVLCAYSCIKPVREAWILALPAGPEYKIYSGIAIGASVALLVPLYAKAATLWARDRLIIGTTLFFACHAVLFFVVGSSFGPTAAVAIAFYIWISIFNMMIVAQFWSFANDLYGEEAGKRLFPLFALGASLGAVAGSAFAGLLIARLGTLTMLPMSAALLVLSAVLVRVVQRRESRSPGDQGRAALEPVSRESGAFKLVFRNRYLLLLALFSLLFTVVKTNGEYVLARLVKDSATHAVLLGSLAPDHVHQYLGAFYARFQLYVNVLGLLLQTVAVSRVVRRLGIHVAFLLLPVVALTGASALLAWPLLMVALPAKVLENATDYSFNNSVRNMLWLPTSRGAKYVAKQVADTFCVRAGDVVSALLVFVGSGLMAWSLRAFVCINALALVLWLLVARAILARYRDLTAASAAGPASP
jgi:AAA family ATP:ADP antiporter